jgi:hypothetical protein
MNILLGLSYNFQSMVFNVIEDLAILNELWKAKCYTFFGLSFNYNFHQEFNFC